MTKITLQEFCAQWVTPKTSRTLASRLSFNAEEFTTKAGEYARQCFAESFVQGGFYGSGQHWPVRTSAWGRRFQHPVMIDQGVLKDAIKGQKGKGVYYGVLGQRDFTRRFEYVIRTQEHSLPIPRKRGASSNKGYAAVHNTDPQVSTYTVNQYSTRKPVQRQFIGHSQKMLEHIHSVFVPHLFDGFPK